MVSQLAWFLAIPLASLSASRVNRRNQIAYSPEMATELLPRTRSDFEKTKGPTMTSPNDIDQWVADAKAGKLSWPELAERVLQLERADGQEHHPDLDRERRCGFGEVIFGEGKSAEAIISIARELLQGGQAEVLITRVARESSPILLAAFQQSRYDPIARTLRVAASQSPPAIKRDDAASSNIASGLGHSPALPRPPRVAVVTAGSTDLSVAREAMETLGWMQVPAKLICDVGVAGPFRLLPHLPVLRDVSVVVVVAGMEGALTSVVGGLVGCPVIAVPTSVGYGFNMSGLTTLLSMLTSCAAGVTVVNIDAGFKGGYVAGLIASQVASESPA